MTSAPLHLSEDEVERRWNERGWGSYRKQMQANAGKCQNDQPQEADMAATRENPMGDGYSDPRRYLNDDVMSPQLDEDAMKRSTAPEIAAYGDYIFIARDKTAEKVSAGGIVIAGGLSKKAGDAEDVFVGVVFAAGPGRMAEGTAVFVPTKAKPGDRVLFVPRRSLDVELAGRRFYVTRETDILGRLP